MANCPQLSLPEDDQEEEPVHLVLIHSIPNSELPGYGSVEVKEGEEETAHAGGGNGIPHKGSSEGQLEEREDMKRACAGEEDDDGYHTPTSPRHRIPAALECPPAPRKPRAQPMWRKRKQIRSRCREFHVVRRRLDFVPSPVLLDPGRKIKKRRTEGTVE